MKYTNVAMAKKDLPQRIWVDQDSCWDNKPQDSNGYVEYVRGDYHSQAMLHVLHKGVKQGKEEMIKKACKWLQKHSGDYLLYPFCEFDKGSLIEDFRKAMEE